MTPRSVEEIMANADDLARRFEQYEPRPEDEVDPVAVRELMDAATARSAAEARLTAAVIAARAAGLSWGTIGAFVGTTGEAARQRYARLARAAATASD